MAHTYGAYIREYLYTPPSPPPLALASHADVLGASSGVDVIHFIFLCFCHALQYIITALQYVVVKHFMSFADVYVSSLLLFCCTLNTEFQDEATFFLTVYEDFAVTVIGDV